MLLKKVLCLPEVRGAVILMQSIRAQKSLPKSGSGLLWYLQKCGNDTLFRLHHNNSLMVRVKRGTISLKSRKSLLKKVKGYRWGRSKKERQAREALLHAGNHAFAHRKKKKGDFRRLWNIRIGAALKPHNLSYSVFIGTLKKKEVALNRKMLSEIAQKRPGVFDRIVETHK